MTSFADPVPATDGLALAHQFLNGLDQRANRILAQVAVLKDSGSNPGIVDRAGALQAEAEAVSLPYLIRYAVLRLALHRAIGGAQHDLATTITRLQRPTIGGDYRFFTDIACFRDGLPLPSPSATRSAPSEEHVRFAWHQLVQTRRALLGIGDRRPDEGPEPEGDWFGAFADGPGWLAHEVSRLRGAVRQTQ
ncbi:hypothetical protein GCM10010331_79730 [Streptomyces xanthochromogenes]|uniref:hypothetical protein n=1 Tax=Streptomyces xanthochromogenes TaxID=67384 RepID=UPI0016718F82|nr:hypothetical protein [Streptomyces xanthochromogenes]GHB80249.1 hypothetical protein GCM10010331_79730 [Streptomyces xanthochromogenes]